MKTATKPRVPDKQSEHEVLDEATFAASSDLGRSLQSLEDEQKEIDKAEAERVARLRAIQSLD